MLPFDEMDDLGVVSSNILETPTEQITQLQNMPAPAETSSKSRTYAHVAQGLIVERDDRKKETVEAIAPDVDKPSSPEAVQQQQQQQHLAVSKNSDLTTDDQPKSGMPAACNTSVPKEPPSSFTISGMNDAREESTKAIVSFNPKEFEGIWRIINDRLCNTSIDYWYRARSEQIAAQSEDDSDWRQQASWIQRILSSTELSSSE